MRSRLLGGLASTAVALGAVTFAAPAIAAPDTVDATIKFACEMPDFGSSADFDYEATVKVQGLRDSEGSSPVTLVAETSDLPGVVPAFISMASANVTISFEGTANGTAVKLTSSGTTGVNPSNNGKAEPVKMPGNIQGTVATTDADLDVVLTKFDFNVAGVGGSCKATSGALPTLTPKFAAPPAPEPSVTPSASPSASPSATPSATPSESPKAQEGKPASGAVTFACTLSAPFNTKFDYKADVKVNGARATADSTKVSLSSTFSDIPGLAPVAITDGKMRIIVKGSVAGEAVTFNGASTVNVGPNEVVAVPTLSAEVTTDAVDADVKLDSFRFEFDEMAGLTISADCTAKSGVLSKMTIGVGEVDGGSDGSGGAGGGSGTNGAGSTTLPRTGGGDAMPVIGLWALALGVAGAGLLVWLPRQRRSLS